MIDSGVDYTHPDLAGNMWSAPAAFSVTIAGRTNDRVLPDRPAMTTISLESLNAGDAASFVAALGDIYEHGPWVAQAVCAKRPFRTLAALHDAMMSAGRSRLVAMS